MPSLTKSRLVVITADQIGSRRDDDRVPAALDALSSVVRSGHDSRSFARTAGDEVQALCGESRAVIEALRTLARLGGWRVGVGIGGVVAPIPDDVRAASGPAFIAARQAIIEARGEPGALAVASDSGDSRWLQAILGLMALQWSRRTEQGWAVDDLRRQGLSGQEIAEMLKISPSAVSQRAKAGGVIELAQAEQLAVRLCDELRGLPLTPTLA